MILKFRYLLVVAVIFLALGMYIRPAFGFSFGDVFGDSTVNTLDPWKVVTGYITPRNAVNGLKVPALVSCNTIDTDGNGVFSCGTDEGGSGASFSTSSTDLWATTDLKLQEISDVDDPSAYGQMLVWSGTRWATSATSSLGVTVEPDGTFSTTSADYWDTTKARWSTTSSDYWETTQTARTADDLSNNTTSDLAEGTNLYWTSARGTTSFNTLFSAGTIGWDTNSADDWSTTSSDYWETTQTARTADDLSNNTTSDLAEGTNLYYTTARATSAVSALLAGTTTTAIAEGSNLYWTSARGTTSFNTLFSANTSGWDTSSADDMATATPWTVGQLAYVTNNKTISSVATGTLTEGVTGLEFTATGNLVGSSAVLNLTSGYSMFLTASGTNWNTFYDTPSNRITAGTGIDWSGNTLNGVYTAGDALTLTGEDFDFDGGATPAGELGGTWASPTIDDSLAVTNWNLTTPTFTTSFTFDGVTVNALSGVDTNILTGTVGTTNAVLTVNADDDIVEQGLTWNVTAGTCTGDGNGGALTVNGSSQIVCSSDDGGGGGSNISGWATTTSQVSGSLNLYTTNVTDILNIGGSSTTSSEFWMDPNTTTFQINGSTGSSTYVFGSANNEWVLGTSDANKNFRIASSTGLFDGVTEFFTITKTGNIGFGSSTPFAKVSLVHTATTSPAFALATSTTQGTVWSFWNSNAGMNGNAMDVGRMSIGYPSYGIWQWAQNGGLRDPLNVSRINTGDWFALECKAEFAKKTAQNTADITGSVQSTTLGGLCGDFSIIEDSNGVVDYVVSQGSGYTRFRPGTAGGVNAAGDGIGYALTTAFMRTATNTPMMETSARIQSNGNATSTVVRIGFTSATGVSADYSAEPTAGCYFTASSTQANIKAVCKDGSTISIADTGTASNTALFIRYRVEMETGKATFFMATSTGKWTNVANLTTGVPLTTSLNPKVTIAGVSGGIIGGELWVRFIRAWYRDPEWI